MERHLELIEYKILALMAQLRLQKLLTMETKLSTINIFKVLTKNQDKLDFEQ